jgi:hypothetical protein
MSRHARIAGAALALALLPGCGAAPRSTAAPAASSTRGTPLRFAYEGIDGRPVSSDALANRVSVIGLLTTYDVHSQVEARFLAAALQRHTPRINVAVLMLEAAENKPLVEAFARSLALPYPVALADPATIAGDGPFAGLHDVPSVVILDQQGREAYRHAGLLDEAALEAALRAVEKGP